MNWRCLLLMSFESGMELAEPIGVDSPILDLLDEFWVSPFARLRFVRLGNCHLINCQPISEHPQSKSNYRPTSWFYFICSHRHNHLLPSNCGRRFEMMDEMKDPMTLKSNWLRVLSCLQIHWIKSVDVIFCYVDVLNISGYKILTWTIEIIGSQEAPQLLVLVAKSALNFNLRLSNGVK